MAKTVGKTVWMEPDQYLTILKIIAQQDVSLSHAMREGLRLYEAKYRNGGASHGRSKRYKKR